ncbi:hypothetical protein ACFFTM_04590 [Pseudoduganella plicata]|uniref:hypothetical protein n=1 Tax=Pseudoduganella plicata TaxID=321984 RepID=UPI001675AC62|nr:hypothetical protein [Pseudoduganella plicata]
MARSPRLPATVAATVAAEAGGLRAGRSWFRSCGRADGRRLARLATAVFGTVALAGCATMTETSEQYVMVMTVLDHQQVAGIGCVLSNDAGRWFVTSPGRVQIRKSTQPLTVDCRKDDIWAYDQIGPKQNASRWGNILLTAGAGQLIDRQTGAGFDYPQTLTVVLRRGQQPGQRNTPEAPTTPPAPTGGGVIY